MFLFLQLSWHELWRGGQTFQWPIEQCVSSMRWNVLLFNVVSLEALVFWTCPSEQNRLGGWRLPLLWPKRWRREGRRLWRDSSSDLYTVCYRSVFAQLLLCCVCVFEVFNSDAFMCLNRMGGELKKAPRMDRLPVIGMDETVHDQPSHEDPPDEPLCDQDPVRQILGKCKCQRKEKNAHQ